MHTVKRTYSFDQQAVEAFWTTWQEDVGAGRLGRAGRKPGTPASIDRSRRDQAVSVALAALRAESGYRRGLAARLAREHGGVPRSWQRAVNDARALHEAGDAGTAS
ncbi:hypothetical protein [Streptomyces sp. NPDC000983]|uniref:hypothetical protein n=1 Tax=Streptomyces sp. NPDC000983 TaxID=3154373 RepID=UPI00332E3E78